MFSFLGLYDQLKSHLFFFRINSKKNASRGSGSALVNFDGVCSVMHSIIMQPVGFPSNLQGVLKPGIRNWSLITLIKFCFSGHWNTCIGINLVRKTIKFVYHRVIIQSKNDLIYNVLGDIFKLSCPRESVIPVLSLRWL